MNRYNISNNIKMTKQKKRESHRYSEQQRRLLYIFLTTHIAIINSSQIHPTYPTHPYINKCIHIIHYTINFSHLQFFFKSR